MRRLVEPSPIERDLKEACNNALARSNAEVKALALLTPTMAGEKQKVPNSLQNPQ
jgi:hypothetical protein